MPAEPAPHDFDAWVALLADPGRRRRALWHLVLSGPDAREAVRGGVDHPDAAVREGCARALDHLADPSSFPALAAMLGDGDPGVRTSALHALACDRCKDGACRPDKATVLGPAARLLAADPDPHVRAMAVEVVGRWVHTDPDAEAAVVHAHQHDPSPAVRKKAGWYAPGGPIHRRTAPKPARR
jgi:HEAT repeat protein